VWPPGVGRTRQRGYSVFKVSRARQLAVPVMLAVVPERLVVALLMVVVAPDSVVVALLTAAGRARQVGCPSDVGRSARQRGCCIAYVLWSRPTVVVALPAYCGQPDSVVVAPHGCGHARQVGCPSDVGRSARQRGCCTAMAVVAPDSVVVALLMAVVTPGRLAVLVMLRSARKIGCCALLMVVVAPDRVAVPVMLVSALKDWLLHCLSLWKPHPIMRLLQ
jgi:hypothetical protein